MSFRWLLILVATGQCFASLAPDRHNIPTANSPILSDDVREQLESELQDSCGSRCVDFMNDFLPLISNITFPSSQNDLKQSMEKQFSRFNIFFKKFITNGQSENLKFLNDLNNIQKVSSSFASSQQNTTNSTLARKKLESLPPRQPGLPCRTQAECDSLDYAINRCSYIRKGAMDAYTGANVAVSAMAHLIAAMWGQSECVFLHRFRMFVDSLLKHIEVCLGFHLLSGRLSN
jgi:hypothetical protein